MFIVLPISVFYLLRALLGKKEGEVPQINVSLCWISQNVMISENVIVETKEFGQYGKDRECHLMFHVANTELPFAGQCREVLDAMRKATCRPGFTVVFLRFFLSDPATQQCELMRQAGEPDCAVSVIGQPPLDGSKIALLAIMQENVTCTKLADSTFRVCHGGFGHLWTCCRTAEGTGSRRQTQQLLVGYGEELGEYGCSLADNCIRTWFFVRDIDVNYSGVVTARNEVFGSQGLTEQTHFIASTGIGGCTADRTKSVCMDAYSVSGLRPGQVRYLYAPTHLNRTSEYGVAFERGTVVEYGDRRHVFISGTASIDNRGNVVYPGDVLLQTGRMLDNVESLLDEAGCGFDDVMHMLVYLRDISDFRAVDGIFRRRFPGMPLSVVYAPVCRPGWLVEMECMAVKGVHGGACPDF